MRQNKSAIDWKLLIQFSADDFRNKYSGSLMGMLWAFIQPLMTILIYWFIFQVGFKSQPVNNYPFILWLISGIVPWFFISESISGSTAILSEYSYLVKKVLFNIDILPLVRVVSCLMVQLFLVLIAVIFYAFFGYYPDVYYLQLFYYLAYGVVLFAGIGYLTAALYPFFKDLLQIISIVLQFVFWLTPIVWNFDIMPEWVQRILAFNPIFYIVDGYRKSFIYKEAFWINWKMGVYYWIVACLFFILGKRVFEKMRPHFADVL